MHKIFLLREHYQSHSILTAIIQARLLKRTKAFKLMKIVLLYAYQTSKDTKLEVKLKLCLDVDLPEFDRKMANCGNQRGVLPTSQLISMLQNQHRMI